MEDDGTIYLCLVIVTFIALGVGIGVGLMHKQELSEPVTVAGFNP